MQLSPSKSVKNSLILPSVQPVSIILESFENANVGTLSSWIPFMLFFKILS